MASTRWVGGIFVVLFCGACSSKTTHSSSKCVADETATCTGAKDCPGTRTCVDGTWSECECDDPSSASGSGASGGSSGSGGTDGNGGASGAPDASSDAGGSSGNDTTGSGGSDASSGSGGSDTGGSGGSDASGGSGGSSDSSGGAGGTSAGSGGSGGDSGSGGTGGAADTTVHGQVINHWRTPVPDIAVMLGDEIQATDSEGRFTFEDVPDEYDVYLSFTNDNLGADDLQGWVFQGLTRRDPTLQVYQGLPEKNAWFAVYPSVSDVNNRVVGVTLGGEYLTWSRRDVPSNGLQLLQPTWYGPSDVTATGHGLAWQETDGLPTSYEAYEASTLLAFDSTASSSDSVVMNIDLTDDNEVTSGTISGTVNASSLDYRTNAVYVRFTDNGVIPVVDDDPITDNFSYVVPVVTNATLTVTAQEGEFDAVGLVFQSNVTPGDTGIELNVPDPSVLLAPAPDAALDENTVFTWSSDFDTSVWELRNEANGRDRIYVVTNKKELTLPTFPNGFNIVNAETYYTWRVETHGDFASVDDAAGPNGFMSEFNLYQTSYPKGPSLSSGTYTISDWGYVDTVTN